MGDQWRNGSRSDPRNQGWDGFSADPRDQASGGLRAGNADRRHATSVLVQAHTDGRLTDEEFASRMESVNAATELSQFVGLLSDVMVNSAPSRDTRRARIRSNSVAAWLVLAAFFTIIWGLTVVSAGHWIYFWPVWPILGTGLPVFMSLAFTRGKPSSARPQSSQPSLPPVSPQPPALPHNLSAEDGIDTRQTPVEEPYPIYRPDDLR